MLVSYRWLSEFVDLTNETAESVAFAFTSIGLEANIVEDRTGWYTDLLLGKVVEILNINDKLSALKVDTGSGGISDIVTAACNVRVGMLSGLIKAGGRLPDGSIVDKRKLAGYQSDGIFLSESELSVSSDDEGIADFTDLSLPAGSYLSDHTEIADIVLDIDITPNRGDATSMIGLARDLAAKLKLEMKTASIKIEESADPIDQYLKVELEDQSACKRYTARFIKDITIKRSPFWMRRRLNISGIRDINNVVDVTNYILLETGHPLHAFDYKKIYSKKVIIRQAFKDEKFVSLDQKQYSLSDKDLLIADPAKPIALAGVMGSANSIVDDATSSIVLEAAVFDPVSVRKTSKSTQISTESSYRFERGVDIDRLLYAQDRATELIASLSDGKIAKGRFDLYQSLIAPKEVMLRFSRVRDIYTDSIDDESIVDILKRLGLSVLSRDEFSARFAIPSHRNDLEREIDLVEEVARIYGYDKIVPEIRSTPPVLDLVDKVYSLRVRLRDHLRSLGFSEALSLSFMNEDDFRKLRLDDDLMKKAVRITNPMNTDWTLLRTTLIKSLLDAADNLGFEPVFEIGKIFIDKGVDNYPDERWYLSGIIPGRLPITLWNGKEGKRDFYHLSGLVEDIVSASGFSSFYRLERSSYHCFYPKRQADVLVADQKVGSFGELHPLVARNYKLDETFFLFEIDLTSLGSISDREIKYTEFTRFPSIKRDIALVADKTVSIDSVVNLIKSVDSEKISKVSLFDIFSSEKIGKEKISIALSLEFQDKTGTMRDDQVDRLIETILENLKTKFGAVLR